MGGAAALAIMGVGSAQAATSTANTANQPTRANDATASQTADHDNIGVIVVTAQRRAENLQDVPAAVTAFSSDDLTRFGITDTMDLTGQTPGLKIKSTNGQSKPSVFLRGIGTNDFNASASAAVGFYADEVYLGLQSGQLFQVFDLERVEVLRGPQGTLYGRNTTGGAVNFFSNRPDGSFRGNGSTSYGRFNQVTLEGGIQAPIADGLSARFSGILRSSDGDGVNLFTDQRINSFDSWSLRGVLRWKPDSGATDWSLIVHGGRLEGDGPRYHFRRVDNGAFPDDVLPLIGVPAPYVEPGGFYDGAWDLPQNEVVENVGASLNGKIFFDGFALYSVTGYQEVDAFVRFDSDGSPLNFVNVTYSDSNWQFSQELRLASDGNGPFSWMFGAYYYEDRIATDNRFDIGRFARELFGAEPDLGDPNAPIDITQRYVQKQRSIAGFASTSYELTEELKATAGLRYTSDQKVLSYQTTADSAILIGIPFLIDVDRKRIWDAVTGNVILDWKATDDLLLYASYNRGFKSGQFNASPFFNPDDVNSADPESVDALEAGFKSQFFNNRLRVNLSAFENRYSDLQVFQFIPDPTTGVPTSRYSNAGKARVTGLEVEVDARPVDGLALRLATALLDARYTQFEGAPDNPATPENESVDFSGNRLIAAPRLNMSGSVGYTVPIGTWEIVPAYDFTYNSRQFFTPENAAELSQKAYWIHNASLGLHAPDDRFNISIWARNITGTEFTTEILPLPDFGVNGAILGDRASYGVTFGFKTR
jgi:iron complex outermembrane receptor protein